MDGHNGGIINGDGNNDNIDGNDNDNNNDKNKLEELESILGFLSSQQLLLNLSESLKTIYYTYREDLETYKNKNNE